MGHPGAGPVLFLPPEFLAQQAQQGPGFGWPMPFIAGPGGPPGMSGMPGAFIGRNGGGGGAARPLPPSREVQVLHMCCHHGHGNPCHAGMPSLWSLLHAEVLRGRGDRRGGRQAGPDRHREGVAHGRGHP